MWGVISFQPCAAIADGLALQVWSKPLDENFLATTTSVDVFRGYVFRRCSARRMQRRGRQPAHCKCPRSGSGTHPDPDARTIAGSRSQPVIIAGAHADTDTRPHIVLRHGRIPDVRWSVLPPGYPGVDRGGD